MMNSHHQNSILSDVTMEQKYNDILQEFPDNACQILFDREHTNAKSNKKSCKALARVVAKYGSVDLLKQALQFESRFGYTYHGDIHIDQYVIMEWAVSGKNESNVKHLIDTYGFHVEQTRSWSMAVTAEPALRSAIENGYTEIVEILIAAKNYELISS